MALTNYQCTGCNRIIQLQENSRALDSTRYCSITPGCVGQLVQTTSTSSTKIPDIAKIIPAVTGRKTRNVLYNHNQPISSKTWTIVHNLDANPVVQVAVDRPNVDNPVEIEPLKVELIDSNTIRVVFDRLESGIAQLIARRSSPNPLANIATVVAEPSDIQLTNNGVLTIATLSSASNVNIGITYIDRNASKSQLYTASNVPSGLSPWSDADTVVVRGREYTVRTLDIGDPTIAPGVSANSSFYFNDVYYNPKDMIILLAQSPFANADRINRFAIFPSATDVDTAINTYIFSNGELNAVETKQESVYPPVFIV